MGDGKYFVDDLRNRCADWASTFRWCPRPTATCYGAEIAAGAFDAWTKELVALAAITLRGGCIASHAHGGACRDVGEDEITEVLGPATPMNGGPGTLHAPRAFNADLVLAVGS